MAMTHEAMANILFDEWMTSSDEKTPDTISLMRGRFEEIAELTWIPHFSDREWMEAAFIKCGWHPEGDGLPTFNRVN